MIKINQDPLGIQGRRILMVLGCGRREGEAEGLGSPENTVAKFEPSLEVTVGGGCWASEICSSPPPRGIQSRTLQGPVPTVPHLPR